MKSNRNEERGGETKTLNQIAGSIWRKPYAVVIFRDAPKTFETYWRICTRPIERVPGGRAAFKRCVRRRPPVSTSRLLRCWCAESRPKRARCAEHTRRPENRRVGNTRFRHVRNCNTATSANDIRACCGRVPVRSGSPFVKRNKTKTEPNVGRNPERSEIPSDGSKTVRVRG